MPRGKKNTSNNRKPDLYGDEIIAMQRKNKARKDKVSQGVDMIASPFIDTVAVASGPFAPVIEGAGAAFKWGIDTLYDDILQRQVNAKRDEYYKPGTWYYATGPRAAPSIKEVPLSPDVDPGSWTKDAKKLREKQAIDKMYDDMFNKNPGVPNGMGGNFQQGIVPLLPINPKASPLQFGWTQHYKQQEPDLIVNYAKKPKDADHPIRSSQPNATMVPAGGFR